MFKSIECESTYPVNLSIFSYNLSCCGVAKYIVKYNGNIFTDKFFYLCDYDYKELAKQADWSSDWIPIASIDPPWN